ncbi:MAG: UbiA family prenyltransferase, partial [Phycisphaerales bacterium]|nr:UbiA family prenyltransferase [Phycisphaerales bacterium]
MSASDAPALDVTPASTWPDRCALALRDIKVAHSVFALPFAVLAACMAFVASGEASGRFAGQLALIVVCMVLARTWAMLINRIADRHLDVGNARTERRAMASGRLRRRDGAIIAALCAAGFILTCSGFLLWFANPWPLLLCVPVLAWIGLYSFTKRFTALCHL